MTETVTVTTREKVTALVEVLRQLPQIHAPVDHTFTPGLYRRTVFMPAGSLIISEIHKTEHPYVVTEGEVSVWTAREGVKHIKAPYHGITKPGTERILYIHKDTVWATYHPTHRTDVAEIADDIIEPRTLNTLTINEGISCLGLQSE